MLWPWVAASVAIHGLVLWPGLVEKPVPAGGERVVEIALSADRSGMSQPVARRPEKEVASHNASSPHTERQQVQQSERPAEEQVIEAEMTSAAATKAVSQEALVSDVSESELAKRESLVRNHLEQFKYYPASARRRGITGEVEVAFELGASGRANMLKILTASGYRVLDDAALDAVRRAVPFPVESGKFHFRLFFRTSS